MPARFWPFGEGRDITSGFGPRWGEMHWGVDFGRTGGSGGAPVYAAQAGTVVMCGPATGFGLWVVIDHPAEAGGGTTVYGHITPEVSLGDLVDAGERVAHVNPDTATNGGVAPHLHFEVHRALWSPPGPDRLDPLAWLSGAREPHTPAGGEEDNMPAPTTFGVDISNHQAGLDLGRVFAEGFEFVLAKVSEGDYFRDHAWPAFRDATLAAGPILVGYHYVRADCDIEAQAELFVDHLGDTGIPAMLDHEANSGGAEVLHAVREAIERRGVRCALTYLPRWYWDQIGRPDLSGLPPLMSSHYGPNRAGIASAIYPGPDDTGWQGYGGLPVEIFQFSERGAVAGRAIDVDAYRGTPDQLRALLTGGDTDMTPEQAAQLAEVHRELTQRYPSRSKYATADQLVDTLAGMLLNVDGRVHEASIDLPATLARLEQALEALPATIAAAVRGEKS
ncbi:peptidoglycan DD-metalloendopeptidase family protein [Nocardia brasiliensis]|uniref:peptidoglycan DD-metalloendopeptidase family protein n=1 Tax=Nocardia brasiliensis TaxID=37326 RepID=UPI0024552850|nr:peptidoglycan DD-metalloendopeptidase family protein [Nocardia brasiliensis]